MRLAKIVLSLAFALPAFADEPPKLTTNNANELKQQYERQLKEFADSIAKAKDNPEEREALEKARDEFKKAMEEKLKEAEKAIPPARGGDRGARFVVPVFPQQPLLEDELLELRLLQQEQLNLLRGLQGLNGLARPNGRIGIQFAPIPAVLTEQMGLDTNVGVVIAAVVPGSAAEKAGLKANDILLQLQGKDVPADTAETVARFAKAKEGDKLDLVVLRKGKKETIEGLVVPAEVRVPDPVVVVPGRINKEFRISIVNGLVTHSGTFDGGLEISAMGRYNKTGTLDVTKIVIKDGDEKGEYDSLEKVPEKYKGRVEKLINNFGAARRGDRER